MALKRRLAPFGLLDRYVLQLFGASFGVAILLVVGIFLILDLSTNLDSFMQPDENGQVPSGLLVARYYLLQVPFVYLQVAPLVTLLAGLFSVSKLMRHREVVAALGAGVSSRRVMAPVLFGGAVLGVAMIGLRELATETLGDARDATFDRLKNGRIERVVEDFRFKDRHGNPVLIEEFRAGDSGEAPSIRGLLMVERHPDRFVKLKADEARWNPVRKAWLLEGGRIEDVDDSERREDEIRELATFGPSDVLRLHKAQVNPFDVSGREARYLAQRDPSNVQYRTLSHYHLSFPLANLVLLLCGIPFLVRFRRGWGPEGVALGFLVGVFYFAADMLTRGLGMEGQLGPLLAAWVPILVFGSLGTVLYTHMRS